MTPELKQDLLDWAEVVDAHRVIPKMIMAGYGYLIWDSWLWFKALAEPSDPQQWGINVMWAAAGGITKWYFDTGRKWTAVREGVI